MTDKSQNNLEGYQADINAVKSLLADGKISQAEQMLPFLPESDEKKTITEDINFRKKVLAKTQNPERKISGLKCPKCSHPIRFIDSDSAQTTCQVCRTQVDITGKNLGKNEFVPRKSFLKLGMIANFFGKKYQIIGVGEYKIKGYEREYDEGYSYERYTFYYSEYVLISEDREYLYLEESNEGYVLSQKVLFKNSKLPEFSVHKRTSQTRLKIDFIEKGNSQTIREYGIINQLGYEGESSYIPKEKEYSGFVTVKNRTQIYDVEWRAFKNKSGEEEILEIENYKSQNIKLPKLYEAFDLKEELEKYNAHYEVAKSKKRTALAAALLGFVMIVVGFMLGFVGNTVVSEKIETLNIPDEGYLIGPIELNSVNRLHTLYISGSSPYNAYYSIGIDILDADKDLIRENEGEIWHESGRDSDGTWSESKTSFKKYFKLTKAGTYYLQLHHWKGTGQAHNISVKLKEKTFQPIYLFIFSGLILIMAYLYHSAGRQTIQEINKGNPIRGFNWGSIWIIVFILIILSQLFPITF